MKKRIIKNKQQSFALYFISPTTVKVHFANEWDSCYAAAFQKTNDFRNLEIVMMIIREEESCFAFLKYNWSWM